MIAWCLNTWQLVKAWHDISTLKKDISLSLNVTTLKKKSSNPLQRKKRVFIREEIDFSLGENRPLQIKRTKKGLIFPFKIPFDDFYHGKVSVYFALIWALFNFKISLSSIIITEKGIIRYGWSTGIHKFSAYSIIFFVTCRFDHLTG